MEGVYLETLDKEETDVYVLVTVPKQRGEGTAQATAPSSLCNVTAPFLN